MKEHTTTIDHSVEKILKGLDSAGYAVVKKTNLSMDLYECYHCNFKFAVEAEDGVNKCPTCGSEEFSLNYSGPIYFSEEGKV